jgi:hypothetical protein
LSFWKNLIELRKNMIVAWAFVQKIPFAGICQSTIIPMGTHKAYTFKIILLAPGKTFNKITHVGPCPKAIVFCLVTAVYLPGAHPV